jgi:hypothetical protein
MILRASLSEMLLACCLAEEINLRIKRLPMLALQIYACRQSIGLKEREKS